MEHREPTDEEIRALFDEQNARHSFITGPLEGEKQRVYPCGGANIMEHAQLN